MRQSIETRYVGPTEHKPARIRATASSGFKRFYSWDGCMDASGNVCDMFAFREAARRLVVELGWDGEWMGGGTLDGYVWVQPDPGDGFAVARARDDSAD